MRLLSDDQAEQLLKRIEGALAPNIQLFADLLENACPRARSLVEMRKAARLARLIESDAWTDAALELVELDLPHWKVRRIVCDDGDWHCRLSAQPWLPEGLDEVAETFHRSLPLAILAAIVQARQQTVTSPRDGPWLKRRPDARAIPPRLNTHVSPHLQTG